MTVDELALLNSTSGTTGLPKCVAHDERRWLKYHEYAVDSGALTTDDVRDSREAPGVASRRPSLREQVHLVISDARMGPAWQAPIGGPIPPSKAIAVSAGHG
jgi:acyl-CoA synthetase (AMP-forming)/AMP-acid ligase II